MYEIAWCDAQMRKSTKRESVEVEVIMIWIEECLLSGFGIREDQRISASWVRESEKCVPLSSGWFTCRREVMPAIVTGIDFHTTSQGKG